MKQILFYQSLTLNYHYLILVVGESQYTKVNFIRI